RRLMNQPYSRFQLLRGSVAMGGFFTGPLLGVYGHLLVRNLDKRALNIDLRPGFNAQIRLPIRSNPNACVIPEEAVRATERGFIAFVPVERLDKEGNKEWVAQARVLDLGFRAPGWVEVREGIQPGELIVRRGAEALTDGTPLNIKGGPVPAN